MGMNEWTPWVMSLIMFWASYRAAAVMIDSSSFCIIKGHSSTMCVCVCVHLYPNFSLPLCRCECNLAVKAVYRRQWYVKFVWPWGILPNAEVKLSHRKHSAWAELPVPDSLLLLLSTLKREPGKKQFERRWSSSACFTLGKLLGYRGWGGVYVHLAVYTL